MPTGKKSSPWRYPAFHSKIARIKKIATNVDKHEEKLSFWRRCKMVGLLWKHQDFLSWLNRKSPRDPEILLSGIQHQVKWTHTHINTSAWTLKAPFFTIYKTTNDWNTNYYTKWDIHPPCGMKFGHKKEWYSDSLDKPWKYDAKSKNLAIKRLFIGFAYM